MNITDKSKPKLYQNNPLPLGELSANSFEDFIYQSLVLLGEQKEFQMISGRQPSGDEGFDCTAKKLKTNELICIQSKRYNNALNTSTVVEEIVKVALDGILNNSTPKYHYIITSGTVSRKLRKQLRQDKYTDLKKECKKLIDNRNSQLTLIEKVENQCKNPYSTICNYIDSLDNLIVWSGIDFQNELIVIWSKLNDILEKHFSLTVVFKEHPRPDFNVTDYIKKKQNHNQNLIPLQFQQTSLPNNLRVEETKDSTENIVWTINDVVLSLIEGKNILISSLGGSGKSSTLSMIEDYLINSFNDIEYIPIKIKLRNYSRNTLKQRINDELNINNGSWRSLPFKFIFLFDALDEMLQHDTQAFIDELTTITEGYNFILTIRNTGLNIETVIPSLDYYISIKPLSYRGAFQIAEKTFHNKELKKFYDEYRNKLSSFRFNFLSLPFVLSLSIEYYKNNKKIPDRIENILKEWIQSKIKNDSKKIRDTNNKINTIPIKYIEQTFSLLLYKSKIEKNFFSIPKDDFHDIIFECYEELLSTNSIITHYLNFDEFISLISHYEILVLENDSHYSTPHQIISDYLIAKEFAKNWKSHLDTSLVNSLYDVWLYSSNFIKENEKNEFLNSLLSFNLILGAKVSKNFGIDFIKKAQKVILENEQNEKVLKRSEAIYALGILGTDTCLERLHSKKNYIDEQHSWQRLRSLAINGDKNILNQIIAKNEQQAQVPMKFSGGTYDIWFQSPPSIITDIARSRLEKWINDREIPLCFSLETIELFGDSYDVRILVSVIENTKVEKEFNKACTALSVINQDLLVDKLKILINKKHNSSYLAKKVLLSHGIKVDISEEFNFFIEQCHKSENKLTERDLHFGIIKLTEFIGNYALNKSQIEKLIETYKSLNFKQDFYIYYQIWEIASKNQNHSFLELIELAFLRNNSKEICLAISYLISLDKLNISNHLSKKINDYFSYVDENNFTLKFYYVKYYLKIGKNSKANKIIFETLEKLLLSLSPETITKEQYSYVNYLNTNVFDFFNLDNKITFDDSTALKLLLINTNHTPQDDKIKKMVLEKIEIIGIENYANRIKDNEVKKYVFDYLLKNHFTLNPVEIITKYLPIFLSHHMFYDTIQIVCKDNWSDELSDIFLFNFLEYKWDPINAQMFEKYTNFYAQILTQKQLIKFEQKRDKQINPLVNRIYKIWLEHNGLSESILN